MIDFYDVVPWAAPVAIVLLHVVAAAGWRRRGVVVALLSGPAAALAWFVWGAIDDIGKPQPPVYGFWGVAPVMLLFAVVAWIGLGALGLLLVEGVRLASRPKR